MAISITKETILTGGAGNPISFSQIRDAFGGSAQNIKASTYLRNNDSDVDWDDENTITSRIPDATENIAVTTDNDWKVDSLRDTVSEYVVTQSGTNENLSFTDSDTDTWNGNLPRNVKKVFSVEGEIGATSVATTALSFDGDLYNLDINVSGSGAIYGAGGSNTGGDGGDALYVNNTYTERENSPTVEVISTGKIYSGGGGGTRGNDGADGSIPTCYNIGNSVYAGGGTANYYLEYGANGGKNQCPPGSDEYERHPLYSGGVVRGACRGAGAYRQSSDPWNPVNKTGYHCGDGDSSFCRTYIYYNAEPGAGGNGGDGGKGKGFANRNTAINLIPHKGNLGNPGSTRGCSGGSSTGQPGNPGNDGGDWGSSGSGSGGGSAGKAVFKRNVVVNQYTDNTLKGSIVDI